MVEQAEILEDHAHAAAQAGERRRSEMPTTSWPKREISPRVGFTDRRISRRSVVLPAPDGPVRNWNELRLDREGEVAQDLRPHAVAHADILELNHRRPGRRIARSTTFTRR